MIHLGFATHPRRDPLAEIEWIAEAGFTCVDLFLEPEQRPETIDAAAIRRRLAAHGLGVVGHLAWYLPIGSPLPRLRAAAVETAMDYLPRFREAGAEWVTIHANWPTNLFREEEGVGWQIEALAELLPRYEAEGMRLMYEPVGGKHDLPGVLARILDRFPSLGCHLDIGHAHLRGRDPAAWIRRFAKRLVHLHLNDNHGGRDEHLPPGVGTVDWKAVADALAAIGYDGTITLEVFCEDRDYVRLGREKIEALLRDRSLAVARRS